MIDPLIGYQLIPILGWLNIIGLSLVLLSCRCLLGINFSSKLYQYGWYKRFYKYHCLYWYLFIGSVLFHTILAFILI
jgi:hypothetical protein